MLYILGIPDTELILVIALVITLSCLGLLYFHDRRTILKLKLAAESSRITPHFIFNSLNLLQCDILNRDIRSANKFLSRFSSLMRCILENSFHQLIPMNEEVAQIQDYLEIESMRFDNKFHYSIEVDNNINIECCRVPPMLIQPFLENAIWHGLLPKRQNNETLIVSFKRRDKRLLIEVIDNGVGRKAKKSHIHPPERKPRGIEISKQRLNQLSKLYRAQFNIEIIDVHDEKDNTGTLVKIEIPLIISRRGKEYQNSDSR